MSSFITKPFLAMCWLVPMSLAGQMRADSGYYIATLGHDTVALERYVRTPTSLTIHQLTRLPETRLVDTHVEWDERGRLVAYEQVSRAVPGTGGATRLTTIATVMGDSIRIDVITGSGPARSRTSSLAADVPFINLA